MPNHVGAVCRIVEDSPLQGERADVLEEKVDGSCVGAGSSFLTIKAAATQFTAATVETDQLAEAS